MNRERRLTRRREFDAVLSQGQGWSNSLFVVRALPTGLGITRFGFIVGRRIGKATARNRLKRRLREVCRQLPVRPGYDVVIIAREPAKAVDFWQIKQALEELFRKAGLLAET